MRRSGAFGEDFTEAQSEAKKIQIEALHKNLNEMVNRANRLMDSGHDREYCQEFIDGVDALRSALVESLDAYRVKLAESKERMELILPVVVGEEKVLSGGQLEVSARSIFGAPATEAPATTKLNGELL